MTGISGGSAQTQAPDHAGPQVQARCENPTGRALPPSKEKHHRGAPNQQFLTKAKFTTAPRRTQRVTAILPGEGNQGIKKFQAAPIEDQTWAFTNGKA